MPKYTFTFKKDDIIVEFTTTDKLVIATQFPKWVEAADKYSRTHKASAGEKKNPASVIDTGKEKRETGNEPLALNPSPARSERSFEEPINPSTYQSINQEMTMPEATEEISEDANRQKSEEVEPSEKTEFCHCEEQSDEAIQEEQTVTIRTLNEEPVAEIVDEISENATEVFDKASTLLKSINNIQNPEPEIVPEPEVVEFEKVLEKSIENPTFEPNKTTDERFLEIISSKNPQNKFEKFMITAYYLSEFEKEERFSLKQINAKMMQNLSELIDHTVLQEAFDKGLVEIVPDLTGSAEVCEYKLTGAGEEYFISGMQKSLM